MAARQSAPVLGALCSRADHRNPPRRQPWTLSIGYRFQPSSRHFVGTVEQIIDTIRERRDRWGFSYVIFGADDIDHMAPVVAALAGT